MRAVYHRPYFFQLRYFVKLIKDVREIVCRRVILRVWRF